MKGYKVTAALLNSDDVMQYSFNMFHITSVHADIYAAAQKMAQAVAKVKGLTFQRLRVMSVTQCC